MVLHQPTPHEITAAVARLIHRHPHLTKRAEKAAAILADINTNFDCDPTDHWSIRSQSERAVWHTVTESTCDCSDYQINAPKSKSAYYCKHRLAFHGYRHLLINELQRRLIGNFKFTNERRRAELHHGSVLALTDERRPRAIAYSPFHKFPRHLCYLRLDCLDRLVPQRLSDYMALAEWLPTVPKFALPHSEPRMEDYAPDRTPELSQDDFRHWMHTGDVPALRLAY